MTDSATQTHERAGMQITLDTPLVGTSLVHAAAVGLVLLALTVPIALRAADRARQPWLATLILASLVLHFVGSYLQVLIVRLVYNNSADFNLYNGEGAGLAQAWRSGNFTLDGIRGEIPGTGAVSVITGGVYSVIGVDQLGGFFVFSWFSLLGLLAFYSAFRVAVPTGDQKRYALIIFLLPSMWYWPSAAGKEAVMMPALGLMTLGAALLLKNRMSGIAPMLAGSVIGGLVRPHEVAMVFGAFGVALLTRRSVRRSLLTPVRWAVTLVVIAVLGAVLARFTATFLGMSSISASALVETMTDANTALQGEGGSSHAAWNPNPLYFPVDVYIVLFKPLPFEITSGTQIFAAVENLTIMALILASWRSLASIPRRMRDTPFVTMCVVFSVGFIYIFSALGNVGLLARERTLLFPLFFVLLVLPSRAGGWRAEQLGSRARPDPVYQLAGPPAGPLGGSTAYDAADDAFHRA